MKTDMRLALLGLFGLALAAIAAAFWTIGGPIQARSEQRDMIRMQDLNALYRHIDCLARDDSAAPDESSACGPRPRDADPFTGELYRIEDASARMIVLCAGFENNQTPHQLYFAQNFDAARGCVTYRRADGAP